MRLAPEHWIQIQRVAKRRRRTFSTITAFVRLALELYLPRLAMEKHSHMQVSDAELTWEGIRITENVEIFAVNGGSRPFYRNLSCAYFDPSGYW